MSSEPSIREMRDDDVDAVVDLLTGALGPGPGGVDRRALFAWKHLANPFGRSIAFVAESGGELVGLRAFMRWRFEEAGAQVDAVRAVDTATASSVRRSGVFTGLTQRALAAAGGDGVALVFNTPNEASGSGYLKMGWQDVARWPMWVSLRRPTRVARAALRRDLASGAALGVPERTPLHPAAKVLASEEAVLLADRAVAADAALTTSRTAAYLRWRYAEGPVAYHALAAPGARMPALIVGRVRERGPLREAIIDDLLWEPGAERAAMQLLWAFAGAAGADHGVASFGVHHPARALRSGAGFRRVPRAGMRFMVRPVDGPTGSPSAILAPFDPGRWALSLGDLELF